MKNLFLLVAFMLGSFAFANANTNHESLTFSNDGNVKVELNFSTLEELSNFNFEVYQNEIKNINFLDCTVTVAISVKYKGVEVKGSASVTADTCKEAGAGAASAAAAFTSQAVKELKAALD